MAGKKRYLTLRHPQTGEREPAHLYLDEQLIGRPLLSGEVVHHLDGDSTNNSEDNLLILPNQTYHAHIEWVLRREKAGQPMLFPELHDELRATRKGTLFEFVVVPGQRGQRQERKTTGMPRQIRSVDNNLLAGFILPGMTYKRLSEQVQEPANPQRSDTFVKRFREEVRLGNIKAINLPGERFTMPKQFTRRGEGDNYQRDTREMLFEVTSESESWFEEQNKDLAVARQGSSLKPTVENIQAGLVNFDALAKETQARMQASYEKGQKLGKSRGGKKPATKKSTTKKS